MSLFNTLQAVGFYNSARDYRQHALTVTLGGVNQVPEGTPLKRKLGIRLITNGQADPEGFQLIPGLTIDEHGSSYTMVLNGFVTTLDRPDASSGGQIGNVPVWFYQGSALHVETPPFKLTRYPFQVELRKTENEQRYNPNKAKYLDFRQDFSANHPTPLLNDFELSSTVLQMDRLYDTPFLLGNDYRQFAVLYIEFRNELNQPVVNPIYEGMEVPARYGHFFTVDLSRSRAHVSADLQAQALKIHPEIVVDINNYEGAPTRKLYLEIPVGWSYSRPRFYFANFEKDEFGMQPDAAAATDGVTRLYQEEMVNFNTDQEVYGTQQANASLERLYGSDPAEPFPFPATLLYPADTGDGITIPWTIEGFADTKLYTVDVNVPVESYVHDATRPWQVYANLQVSPEAGEVGLKSAVWVIDGLDENDQPIETLLPAYFVRYVTGTMPPVDGSFFNPDNQRASVFNCPAGMEYIERSRLGESVAMADGVGTITMRVAPPPVDGHGFSPYINIKPTTAKLRLTFHRPVPTDSFEFFKGSYVELQQAAIDLNSPVESMPPIGGELLAFSTEGTINNPDFIYHTTSDLAFNWNLSYPTFGVKIGSAKVTEILGYFDNPDYIGDIGWTIGQNWQMIDIEEFRNAVREDGSVLLPLGFTDLSMDLPLQGNPVIFSIYFEPVDWDVNDEVIFEITGETDFNNLGLQDVNQALALPFEIGNVLQGRTADEVTVELVLGGTLWGDRSFVGRTTLDTAADNGGKLFAPELIGIEFEAYFYPETDKIVVTKMGGPLGALALSSATDVLPYAAVTLPATAVQKSVDYLDWHPDLVGQTIPVSKNIIPLPYDPAGDLYSPAKTTTGTVELLSETQRSSLSTVTYTSAESATHNLTLTAGEPGYIGSVSAEVDAIAPYISTAALELAGYQGDRYHFKRECVAVKVTDPDIIADCKAQIASTNVADLKKVSYLGAYYTIAATNEVDYTQITLGELSIAMEGEVECLYIPVPLYSQLAIGNFSYEVALQLPNIGYQQYEALKFKVNCTFNEPLGLTAVDQANEVNEPDITALFTQATNIAGLTLYASSMKPEYNAPVVPFTATNGGDEFCL